MSFETLVQLQRRDEDLEEASGTPLTTHTDSREKSGKIRRKHGICNEELAIRKAECYYTIPDVREKECRGSWLSSG